MTPPKFRDATWAEFLLSHIHLQPSAIHRDHNSAPLTIAADNGEGTAIPQVL